MAMVLVMAMAMVMVVVMVMVMAMAMAMVKVMVMVMVMAMVMMMVMVMVMVTLATGRYLHDVAVFSPQQLVEVTAAQPCCEGGECVTCTRCGRGDSFTRSHATQGVLRWSYRTHW